MKEKCKNALWLTAGIIIPAFIIWSALWLLAASEIKKQAEIFIADAAKNGVLIVTRSLVVENYPFVPEINFSGRISANGYTAEVPLLLVHSLFLVEKPLLLEAPRGLSILEPADTALLSLDKMHIDILIPASLPPAMTHEAMEAWKKTGNTVKIQNIAIEKGALKLEGSGVFMLDDSLQPAGEIDIRTTGHMEFLQWLRQEKYIETKEALLSGAVLAGLSRIDPDTNETIMDTSLTLQNRTLFAGPLRLAVLPQAQWRWQR